MKRDASIHAPPNRIDVYPYSHIQKTGSTDLTNNEVTEGTLLLSVRWTCVGALLTVKRRTPLISIKNLGKHVCILFYISYILFKIFLDDYY